MVYGSPKQFKYIEFMIWTEILNVTKAKSLLFLYTFWLLHFFRLLKIDIWNLPKRDRFANKTNLIRFWFWDDETQEFVEEKDHNI